MKKYFLSTFYRYSFSFVLLCLLIWAVPYDANGWCPMSPSPQENSLFAVWGSSENDVFAVGEKGTVIHYDGTDWSTMVSGTVQNLTDIWGSSSSNVFAVGSGGTILHYNGISWATMNSGTENGLSAVWGSNGNDVFAVGDYNTLLHYNGDSWTQILSESVYIKLSDVWGNSENNVYAVGCSAFPAEFILGVTYQYDGKEWSGIRNPAPGCARSIWGSSGSDIFTVVGELFGSNGNFYHYDGISWTEMSSGNDNRAFELWGRNGNDVFAVGYDGKILHYNGTTWSTVWLGTKALYGVWGSDGGETFVVGKGGIILHSEEDCQMNYIAPILSILLP